jgi:hypothetical protein
MELTEFRCKNCGAPIEGKDVAPDLAMAKCSHCGAVFGVKGLSQQETYGERPAVPMPAGVEVADFGDALQITYRWFSLKVVFVLIICVFWNVFMFMWHGMSITTGVWSMSLFGLLHTAVGIGLAYYTLAGLLNRTTVRVEQGLLEIHHHPLPWFGNKRLQATDIEQIYCRERIHHGRHGVSRTYEVHAMMRDAVKEKLLSRLNEPEQVLYIEQELERFLGIRDGPVRGEIPR